MKPESFSLNVKTLILSGLLLTGLFEVVFYFKLLQPENTEKKQIKIEDSVPYKTEVIAENLKVPWSILFTSSERILVSERTGSIRAIENGKLLAEPLITFNEVSSTGEEGLMGLEKDPYYSLNKYLYVCLAYGTGELKDKVVRLVDEGNFAKIDKTIIDNIPAAIYHAGCRIKFGPDKKLYITTGDALNKKLPQDLNSLAGKILRINSDGSIPLDNPFPNSPVFTYGHRNPQGLAWDRDGQLFSSEHGPSGNDGPPGGDEINEIYKGLNYGWPIVSHVLSARTDLKNPAKMFTPAVAPASAEVYTGDAFPQLKGDLLVGALKGEGILWFYISKGHAVFVDKLKGINFGRIRDVVTGPDGYIYFSTSNTDGRGVVRKNDDKIYRLVPLSQ